MVLWRVLVACDGFCPRRDVAMGLATVGNLAWLGQSGGDRTFPPLLVVDYVRE